MQDRHKDLILKKWQIQYLDCMPHLEMLLKATNERMKRILHIVTLFERGGAQSVVLELARAFAESGNEVGVMAAAGGEAWEELDPRVRRFPSSALAREVSPRRDIQAFLEILKVLREFRPDILHLHSSKAGVLGRAAGAVSRMSDRSIYTIHGFDTILKAHRVYLPLERILSRFCGTVVAVSDYDLSNLRRHGIRNAVCVANAVRDFREDPEHPDAALVRALESARSGGRRVVVTLARLAPPKRFDLVARTARILEPEGYSFFWIGNREPPSGPLPGNLSCLGDLPGARLLLRHADVCLLLSDYEGLPMSVLESLCAGVPVVASDVGGIPEALRDGGGITVLNDPAAAAAAIRRVAETPEDRVRFGASARASYEDRYSVAAMAGAYRRIYERPASRDPGRRGMENL